MSFVGGLSKSILKVMEEQQIRVVLAHCPMVGNLSTWGNPTCEASGGPLLMPQDSQLYINGFKNLCTKNRMYIYIYIRGIAYESNET